MGANRYSSFLTIILIITIVVIVVLLGILGYNIIKKNKTEIEAAKAIAEFEQNVEENDDDINEENNDTQEIEPSNENTSGTTNQKKVIKKTYYKEFIMVGYITISKTNVKQPILASVSPKALETAVAVIYPSNPQLNQPGNVVIVGHNYRNGQFFSNNKKLSVGDKISIKDESGKQLIYTIYEIFETTPEDTEFYNRDTNGAIEVTLSTCTDDGKARTVILAKVK